MQAIYGIPGLIVIAAMAQGQVTFTKDVAPILQNRCQSCHRPDTFAAIIAPAMQSISISRLSIFSSYALA